MIPQKPKKERRFLKMLGRVGEVLVQEALIKVIKGVIARIGSKKKLPTILFCLISVFMFAQYPSTGNKQRLGYQTTGDGLVWRGSLSDTASIQPTNINNAWVIIDTVNLKFYSFDFTSNKWNSVTVDTSFLNNYATTSYVDSIATNLQDSIDAITNGYYKQQFLSVTSDTLLWTRNVQLPTDENLLLTFRNGQILNNSQYTRIDTNKVKIASNSYKIGDNYTVVYIKGGGGSGGGGLAFDTTELNLQARLDLKLNISDTAAMLANYASKAYADTSGRFYARQDFTNVSSSTLTWTQSDTLVTGGVTVVQVYRNGQILLPSQYTIPTNASVVIASSSYKEGENYTVIFPRGGGAGSGGSGSLTSISAGTGITVNPNPITTTGTVSADLTVLMELSDTTTLSNRINLKLNAADTASLSNRINAKGSGTVTSIATGYGLSGGTITTSGTLLLDSATVFNRIRDSIVDVAIGTDTIKILKQEYSGQTSAILNWTVTSKFPIQLKAFILVFRNGQLLNNNQYDITDTAQITIVSSSFKSGGNYTVATVSGIGSVGSGQASNPTYPDAGIALSTGSTWASSITNNSSNWNTAYNKKINSISVTGTTTKTISLLQQDGSSLSSSFTDNGSVTSVGLTAPTGFDVSNSPITSSGNLGLSYSSGYSLPTTAKQSQWDIAYNDKIASLAFTGTDTKTLTLNQTDGGTVTGTFTDLQGITSSDTASMLTNYLRTGVAASTYLTQSNASSTYTPLTRSISTTSPLSGGGDLSANRTLTIADAAADGSTKGAASFTAADFNASSGNISIDYTNGTAASGSTKGFLTSTDWTTFNNKQAQLNGTGFVKASGTSITYDNSTYLTTSSAASTYQTILTNPVTGTGASGHLLRFTGTSSIDSTGIYASGNRIGVGIDASTAADHLSTKFVVRDNGNNFRFNGASTTSGYTTTISHDDTGLKIGHSSDIRDIRFTLNGTSGLTIANNGNSPVRAVGIGTDAPAYKLDVNGTLGVTGAATLSGALTVNNATVLNEGSGDYDTRIESDGNANMVFVDASTNRVGIGTNSPDSTLTVNGSIKASNLALTNALPVASGGTGNTTITGIKTDLDIYKTVSTSGGAGSTFSLSGNNITIVVTGSSGLSTTIDFQYSTKVGDVYIIKNLSNTNIVSSSSNVILLSGGSAQTSILGAGNVTPQWCTLVYDGTNWHIMQKN